MSSLFSSGWIALALLCLTAPEAQAQLGQVEVAQVAPDFPAAEVRKAVFCIRETGHKGFDQTCATASLVHESGLVATAAHVVSNHGNRDFEIVTAEGKAFQVQTVWVSPTYDPQAGFLKDVQKLMVAEAKMRFGGGGFRQQPIYDEINSAVFTRADIALLKVVPEDLPALLATGARPLPLRKKKALSAGEPLLLAGFTWTHYAPGFLESLAKQGALPEGGSLQNTNGRYSVLAGLYHSTRGKLILTRANPAQEKGEDPGTDAIDSFSGSSGAPVLDETGAVVGFHSASDSSLGQFSMVRKSMVQLATSVVYIEEGLASLGIERK